MAAPLWRSKGAPAGAFESRPGLHIPRLLQGRNGPALQAPRPARHLFSRSLRRGLLMAGVDADTSKAMLAVVPELRAFAISLCGNVDRADDLVQETLLRALAHIDSFQPGTNLSAWMLTILRNQYYSEYRKRRREVEDGDGTYAEGLMSQPEQFGRLQYHELRDGLP